MAYDDRDGRNPQNGQYGYGQGSPYGYQRPANPYGYVDYDNGYYDEDEEKRNEEQRPQENGAANANAEPAPEQEEDIADGAEGVPPKEKKHLSRKERRELEKRQYELEKKLVKAGKIPPRIHYTPHHTFGRILAICLTFFFGIFMALGGIVGGIYIAGTKTKLKNVISMTGADANAILTETAQELSLLQLVDEVKNELELLGSFNEFSLDSLAKYTPVVDNIVDQLLEQTQTFGIHIEKQKLMEAQFGALNVFLQNDVLPEIVLADIKAFPTDDPLIHALCFKEDGSKVKLGEVLDAPIAFFKGVALADALGDVNDPVFSSLLYDKEGNKHTIGDLIDNGTDIIQDTEIEVLLDLNGNSNSAMRYLAYGSEFGEDGTPNYTVDPATGEVTMREGLEKRTVKTLTDKDADLLGGARLCDLVAIDESSSGIMQAIKNWTVEDLKNQEKIETLSVGDVFGTDGTETGLMGAISGWTLKELQQQHRIERLKISQVLNLGDTPSALLSAIGGWRIGDLNKQEKIDSLTIGDVITVNDSSPALLKSIKNAPLGELGDAIDSLRLSDILSESDLNGNKILRNLKLSTLGTLSEDVKKLSVADVFGEEIYSYLDVAATKASFDSAAALHAGEDIGMIQTGTYAELISAYGKNKKLKHLSEVVPKAVKPQTGETIESFRIPLAEADGANPARLELGYFTENGGVYTLAEGKIFHKEGAYTVERRLALTPEYGWRIVNFETGAEDALPAGDSVAEKNGGYVYRTGEDEFPVLQDGFGYYYASASGRVDLEREIISYRAGSASYPVTNGKITYGGENYLVRKDSAGSYILPQVPVTPYYYAPSGTNEYTAVYTEEQTTLRHVLVSGGTQKVLDRYLSGVWYLLLGGEEENADGTVTIIDNSHSGVLEIGDKIAEAANVINGYDLGEMYLHGFITSTPYRDISVLNFHDYKNLNELSISAVIELVDHLMNQIGA